MSNFPELFQPIRIGGMEIKNRFAKPPMGSNLAEPDHSIGQTFIDYYAECSKGGFGLIIVEISAVDPIGCSIKNEVAIWDDSFIGGWKKLADAVHAGGGKLCVQLHHAGKATRPAMINGALPVAPSPLPDENYTYIPHALTTEETYKVITEFVDAAERAAKAGCDAVEVHGAHGYLIAEYMSSKHNCRLDEFGGSFENRMRLPKLIIQGIHERLGRDFPVTFRMSVVESGVDGRDVTESRAVAKFMEDAGADAIHVSVGDHNEFAYLKAPSGSPLAYEAHLAERIKQAVNIPVITVGRINDPYIAQEIVSSGMADIVALGRQSIADPHFPNKVKDGLLEEIIPCIGCHQGCSEELTRYKRGITCALNPFAGRNSSIRIHPANIKKHVIVVGGGPGGMEAAWLMAMRGHKVTLFEKGHELGGTFSIAACPPGKSELVKPLHFYKHMCEKYGVDIRTDVEVTPEMIGDEKPDAVVLATGRVPIFPKIKGIEQHMKNEANEILTGRSMVGKKVLLAGGGLVGVETADYLANNGRDVTIIEMKPEIAFDVAAVTRVVLMPRLQKNGVKTLLNATIKEFLNDGIIYELDGKEKELRGFDSIVLAMGGKPYNPLEEKITGLVPEVYVIGDAKEQGRIMQATADAAKVALAI